MSDQTPACRWNGLQEARILPGRHGENCPDKPATGPRACQGCEPCPEPHCVGDACRGRNHADAICAECLASARDDLAAIEAMCGVLPTEAQHRGVDSEAAMLAGPAADPEAWRYRATSAMFGRLDDAYLADCRDEQHPLWVLAWIEQEWREALDQPTGLRVTIERAAAYIGRTMHVVAGMDPEEQGPEFADAAKRLRQCRAHLEDVLSEGERQETGAPCPACGERALVKDYGDHEGDDRWKCPNRACRQWWSDHDYRAKVEAVYELHAEALTASGMQRTYRIKPGSLTGWASAGKVRKRGKDRHGRQLYDVRDALKVRGKLAEARSA